MVIGVSSLGEDGHWTMFQVEVDDPNSDQLLKTSPSLPPPPSGYKPGEHDNPKRVVEMSHAIRDTTWGDMIIVAIFVTCFGLVLKSGHIVRWVLEELFR